jgi:hypothetical protein
MPARREPDNAHCERRVQSDRERCYRNVQANEEALEAKQDPGRTSKESWADDTAEGIEAVGSKAP